MRHRNKHTGKVLASSYGVCGGCHRNFSSQSGFEMHRSGPHNARVCLDPSEIGLTQRDDVWFSPPPKDADRGWLRKEADGS